jgi:hypothetical protein
MRLKLVICQVQLRYKICNFHGSETVKSCISALSVWTEVPLSQRLSLPSSSVLDGGGDSLKDGSLFCTDLAFHLRRLHYSQM